MDILYPSTKFYIPRPRRRLVRRQRLFIQLNEGIHNKLILICAPAGYGKTTLVTSWLANVEMPIAWVSADEADNDIYHFFVCLLESLRESDILTPGKLRQMLESAMPPSSDSLATLFLNEIAELQHDCLLVIDDYHLITNPAVHSALHMLIEQSAPNLHFIICSRAELPFSVSRMRAQSDLLELSQQELSLTLDESGLYLNMVMGSGLKAWAVAALHERTEGWLAGLQLAALSIRDQQDQEAFIRNLKGDNRYVADYLVDEVLAHIPGDLQDFLLRTSVIREMNASLCDFILKIDHSQDLLETLDHRRLFIIPLDENRQSFRYHQLFRELLYTRLTHKLPECVAELYQRASRWHVAHGTIEDAIDYALEGNDYAQAASLIKKIGITLLSHGRWNQLLNWYNRFPEAEFRKQYDLWLNYFTNLINKGLIAEAAQKIEVLSVENLRGLNLSSEELDRVRGELAAVQGVITLHSKADPLQAKECLEVARECLSGDVSFRRAFANNNYAVSCLLLGDVEEARQIFEKNAAWGRQNRVSQARVMGTSYLAEATAMAGELQLAHELFQDTIQYVHEEGLQQGALFSKTNLGLGSLYYEWNKLYDAVHYLTEGIRLAEQGGYLEQLLPGYIRLARAQLVQGDSAGAKESIGGLRKVVEKYGDPPIALAFLEAAQADLALLQGELGTANRWADRRRPSATNDNTLFSEYEQLVVARVLQRRDEHLKMCELIRPLRELAEKKGRVAALISYDVMAAKCLFLNGEPESALRMLEDVLVLAEPGQFLRTFLDEGGVIISMIKQLTTARASNGRMYREVSLEYLHLLLDEAAKDTVKASTGPRGRNGIDGLEPLTGHEFKILQLLESGYTNKQISNELSISLNTVKYHLKNIYGKMGVTNRTQASRALRE